MSIRLRMTLLYSTILALTLIAFGAILYTIQSRYTLNLLRRDLLMSAQPLALAWARSKLTLDPGESYPRLPDAEDAEDGSGSIVSGFSEGGVGEFHAHDNARLLGADGMALDLPGNIDRQDLPLSREGLEQLQGGRAWTEMASTEEGRWLIYSQPVIFCGEMVGIVQTARSLADRDRSMQALGITFVAGSALTTVIAFGIGWMLSAVTLRPIRRITQAARKIGQERDFSSRVEHEGSDDELGRLATTLNGMLSRLQDAYQRVADALRVQRDFVADVSHQLRMPLATIRGHLDVLRREPSIPSAKGKDVLEDLDEESERLIRLVSDLLTLARAEAGRTLAHDCLAVKVPVDAVCRQARLPAPELELECAGSSDALALADRDALQQALPT